MKRGKTLEDIEIIDSYPKYFIEESEFFFHMYYSQLIYRLNKTKTANRSILKLILNPSLLSGPNFDKQKPKNYQRIEIKAP